MPKKLFVGLAFHTCTNSTLEKLTNQQYLNK